MPEYRRFIAYFYEYIEGKKQKNAGFAKVELRNGMWRILFRLTTDVMPDAPIQVYGFVRESGYLLGFSMGTMQMGREIAEEWAYRADTQIGHEKYRFADLSGIWIQSGNGRNFITVWDDEALNPQKFVLELPEEEKPQKTDRAVPVMEEAIEPETAGAGMAVNPETDGEEMKANLGTVEAAATEDEKTESVGYVAEEERMVEETSVNARSEEYPEAVPSGAESMGKVQRIQKQPLIEDILQKRKNFTPFQDDEISGCVQLMPCDVARLQQESWKVGRSSFLQHGFYQYRHLLLGKTKDGAYVIGVPGIRNPQEKYMAEMFGYDRFKTSRLCECGKSFGYWYRTLTR